MTEENWDTGEASLHIANTEWMYLEARATETVEAFKSTFYHAIPGVYGPNVDWQSVFDDFEEDRKEYHK